MTRKDILKKYGFSWMSNVDLREELSEKEAAEFEDLIRTLAEHNRGPEPPEEGWKKRMYKRCSEESREDERKMATTKEKTVPMRIDTCVRPVYIVEDMIRLGTVAILK